MRLIVLALIFTTTGLTGCQNPIRDPIDSVVEVVTDPRKEIQKGAQSSSQTSKSQTVKNSKTVKQTAVKP